MVSQLGRISWGRDDNFYKELSISSTNFGGDNPDGYGADGYFGANLMIPFSTQTVIITNDTTSGANKIVEFSLNGTTVHGILDPNVSANTNTRVLTFTNRVISKMWFRVRSGSTGPLLISVSAWAVR